MADKPAVSSELSRDLTLFHITMMGLGMMIGAGVFIGIGNVIGKAGPGGLLLTFALNGVIAFCTAMSYAELSSAIPRAGGAYNFARIGFGRGTSFLAGWIEWLASSVAGSLYAVVFATYTMDFMVQLGYLNREYFDVVVKIVAFLVAALFIYINYRGTSETGKIGAFFTLGQMILIGAIGVIGIYTAITQPERFDNFKPFIHPDGWMTILVTMGFTSVAFEGFEVIAQAGDETIDPKRNMPKAMLYSVFIVTLTYVGVAFASVVAAKAGDPSLQGLAPWEWIASFGDTGFGQAVAKLMPNKFIGYVIVTMAVIFASTSALNATIFSATRVSYALGRDRMLPAAFSKISKKRRTPWIALLFTSFIVVVVAVFLPARDVGSSASIMFIMLFFLVNLCVIKIRRNMVDELEYGFLMPLFPLFPIVAIILQAVLAVFLHEMSWIAWVVAPVWLVIGVGIYRFYSKTRAVTTEEEILVLEEEIAPVISPYNIMVAVANPQNALGLVRNTYRLASVKKAHIELLHMVQVPSQVPLHDAEQYAFEGKEAIVEAMLYLRPMFPVSTTLRYCRNIARGIVSTVREKKIDMLIMGWHGKPTRHLFTLGSTIDPIIELAPCDVAIFKDCGSQKFKRILVPLAGGPHGGLALELASILLEESGEIVAFTVRGGKAKFDIDQFVEKHRERLQVDPTKVWTKGVRSDDVVTAILDEGRDYDLIVLGSTHRPFLYQITHEPIPETVAKRYDKPLVMVKASTGLRSWVERWF